MTTLIRNPQLDTIANIRRYFDKKKGLYFYFRTQSMITQKRFVELFDVQSSPLVFLHGNPHIDNYARTGTGCGMIDFDRSRIGPYSWDICRLIASIAAYNQQNDDIYQLDDIFKSILAGYTSRVADPSIGYEKYRPLMEKQPQTWQLSTKNYVEANKKWAKRMRANPVDPNNKKLIELFECYARSRRKMHFLDKYKIAEAGKASGSMGKGRFIVYLICNERGEDDLLLDFKEVYDDPDTRYFYNPYKSHGHRMVEASRLYAEGVEQRVGYGSIGGQEYWIRQIPAMQMKIKGQISQEHLKEFSYCVATQLGLAHRNSLLFVDPENFLKRVFDEYQQIIEISMDLSREVHSSYKLYLEKARSELQDLETFLSPASP